MMEQIEALVSRYDAGQVSRRELLGALVAITLTPPAHYRPAPLIGTATGLNHATLYVHDVPRSQEFYQKLFGMPILTRQGRGVNLRAGGSFVGLYPVPDGDPPRIAHICISVDGFDAARALTNLREERLNAEIVRRGDTEELYFDDPDGISVQIQDTRYRGGVGRLGDRDPP